VTEMNFSRGRFNHRCDFLLLFHCFLTFQNNFVDTMSHLNDIFFTKCLSFGFESLCSLKFFHLSRFRSQISPPNVFLRKFQHLFSTLKHYNLSIYIVKWSQICFTPSTTCTLQDCMVEIFIPHWNLDL